MRFSQVLIALLLATGPVRLASAHEFWISPVACQLAPGEKIEAHFRVGQMFQGAPYPYMPGQAVRNGLAGQVDEIAIPARVGDMPALKAGRPGEGLWVLVHQTSEFHLTYTKPETFPHFVELQGLEGALDAHAARGLPETGFKENYTRYAKALVAVGHGRGGDRAVGFETEFVALANPYRDDVAAGLPVQLFERGRPRADVQVELFAKRDGVEPTRTVLRTDGDGRVVLPVKSGFEYLASAVVLRPTENDDPATGAVWHSHWASLSFCIP